MYFYSLWCMYACILFPNQQSKCGQEIAFAHNAIRLCYQPISNIVITVRFRVGVGIHDNNASAQTTLSHWHK